MPYTETERIAIQQKMFGCTTEDINQMLASAEDPLMMAMSYLSDAQEMLASDPDDQRIRQLMNIAKYILDHQRKGHTAIDRILSSARRIDARIHTETVIGGLTYNQSDSFSAQLRESKAHFTCGFATDHTYYIRIEQTDGD